MSSRKFIMSLIQNRVYPSKSTTLTRVSELIDHTVKLYKPNIVVLPELFGIQISLDNIVKFSEEKEHSESLKILSEKSKEHSIYLVGGSIGLKENGKVFNASFSFNPKGEIIAEHRKVHLFDIDIPGKVTFKESDKLSSGGSFTTFDTPFARFGIGICYDLRFPEYLSVLKSQYKIDCMIYPSAFTKYTGELHWDLLGRSRALDNNLWVALCSPARDEDSGYPPVYGHSMIVNPYGKVVAKSGHEENIVNCEIDLNVNSEISEQIPTWKQKRIDMYETIKKI